MEKAKIVLHVAASATPEPAPTPTTPRLFVELAAANAAMDESMRQEWDVNAPEDEDGEKLAYPDDWEQAHDAMAAQNDEKSGDDELWGEYRLTSHEVELPLEVAVPRGAYDDAIGALRELKLAAEAKGAPVSEQVVEALRAADSLSQQGERS